MKYTFANGTAEQQDRWSEAVSHLISMPADSLGNTIKVEFVDPSAMPGGHTDLAATTWTYGSADASTIVRDDAPGFGDQRSTLESLAASLGIPYSAEKFYMETAVHELGHAVYASLSEASRVAIAQLFGAQGDDLDELRPPGTSWQDQIMEGIAETFKEAFLPRRFRVFPNRTHKTIPYHKFAEFRSLCREAVPQVIRGGEPLEEGEEEVPAYDVDIFKQGGFEKTEQGESETPSIPPGAEPIGHNNFEYLIGIGGLWDTFFEEGWVWHSAKPTQEGSFLRSEFSFQGWVKDGTVLSWELLLGLAPFDGDGSGLQMRIVCPKTGKTFFEAIWIQASEAEGGFTLLGDAKSFPPPPTEISDSMVVNSTNFGNKTRKCHGETYRYVEIDGLVELDMFTHSLSEHVTLRETKLYPFLGPFRFLQNACSAGGETGPPIEVPVGTAQPGGSLGGSQPYKRPVVGNTQ